jgi:hypothetical protein
MPDWPLVEAGRMSSTSESWTVANGGGVLVTAGAINTKGTPAVVSASTPFEAHGIFVTFSTKSSAADQLIDIMVGGAGVEQVLIPNIYYAAGSNSAYGKHFFFPACIAAGTRVTARSQSATASVTARVSVALLQQSFLGLPGFSRFLAFGADTAASRGTPLGDPAANAWGAWTQLTASLSDTIAWLLPIFGDRAIATRTSGMKWHGQLGEGAAAAEQSFGPEYPWYSSSTALSISSFVGFPTEIASGQRLSARYTASAITNLGIDCVVYGAVG